MTTRFVGVKTLRQNMATISKQAQRKNQRVIVVRNNVPVFELRPITAKDILHWQLESDIAQAESSLSQKSYSTNEVRAKLGLKSL